jgi:hypothetical protein
VSYYLKRAKKFGYINEVVRDKVKTLDLTQPGKNFLAMYENQILYPTPVCRAENIRFKAEIVKMPSLVVDWRKIEMNNLGKYVSQSQDIKVHINMGKIHTIEFIAGPDSLRLRLLQDCTDVARNLEDRLDMEIGRLELLSRGEWVVYRQINRSVPIFCQTLNVSEP